MSTQGDDPLDVPVIGQPNGFTCGSASLAAAARFLGRGYSSEQLAVLARTTRLGTDHSNMIAGATATGATVFAKSYATVEDLRFFLARKLPPIVGWWAMEKQRDTHHNPRWPRRVRRKKDCGHYSVVTAVTDRAVTLMDPQEDPSGQTYGRRVFDRSRWMTIWYDTDTDRYTRVVRWMMVLNYDGERFADERRGRDYQRVVSYSAAP